ncbi:MAG: four helix bundle protein [Planctomycetota bacterium]
MEESKRSESDVPRKKSVRRHTDLSVYEKAFCAAMQLFRLSKSFPIEERFSLTDQCRRSSRSVCANIAEAWRKRRYPAAFVAKLFDSEAEAAETQTWLQFAVECEYVSPENVRSLYAEYDQVIGMLVTMIKKSEDWTL